MKQMDLDELTAMCVPYLVKAGRIEETLTEEKAAWLKKSFPYQPQMSFAAQIVDLRNCSSKNTLN